MTTLDDRRSTLVYKIARSLAHQLASLPIAEIRWRPDEPTTCNREESLNGFRGHFDLKHRVLSFLSQRFFRDRTYRIRHGLAAGMRRKGGLGFLAFFPPRETSETRFLSQLPLTGKVVYDVGAFEGLLTLFFARTAKRVISWEPNPRNYERCLENVRLNALTNVQLNNRGISDQAGVIELTYDPLMPGAGSGQTAIATQIVSSVKSVQSVSVSVLPLDLDLVEHDFPPPDLIKIDIEGMEYPALLGMRETLRQHRPELFIEMHGATLSEKSANARAVMSLLESYGYSCYDVGCARELTSETPGEPRPAHLYCRVHSA
ncbi:MAG: FkbM family methyltransferase [Gemmatimonadota bacterium]|nr:FkbM family methyltransferase [Gemmatimonadota bacterium]